MTSDSSNDSRSTGDDAEDSDVFYTLEIIAELAGVDPPTVIRYQEQGFLKPARPSSGSGLLFDSEGLRQLRRMEHLRVTCGVNEAGLQLILSLLQEVEELRSERRRKMW